MKKKIYESDNWIVELDEKKNITISYFKEGHYKDELILDINNIINNETSNAHSTNKI